MSQLGQTRKSARLNGMSVLPPTAGVVGPPQHVRGCATSGLMHRRPSHRQAIGDEQGQAVSDDLRLAAAVKGHAASGPRAEVISRRNISGKHGFFRCGLSIKPGGSAALAYPVTKMKGRPRRTMVCATLSM